MCPDVNLLLDISKPRQSVNKWRYLLTRTSAKQELLAIYSSLWLHKYAWNVLNVLDIYALSGIKLHYFRCLDAPSPVPNLTFLGAEPYPPRSRASSSPEPSLIPPGAWSFFLSFGDFLALVGFLTRYFFYLTIWLRISNIPFLTIRFFSIWYSLFC